MDVVDVRVKLYADVQAGKTWVLKKPSTYAGWCKAWNQYGGVDNKASTIDWEVFIRIEIDNKKIGFQFNASSINEFDKRIRPATEKYIKDDGKFYINDKCFVVVFTQSEFHQYIYKIALLYNHGFFTRSQLGYFENLFWPDYAKGYLSESELSGYYSYIKKRIDRYCKNNQLEMVLSINTDRLKIEIDPSLQHMESEIVGDVNRYLANLRIGVISEKNYDNTGVTEKILTPNLLKHMDLAFKRNFEYTTSP